MTVAARSLIDWLDAAAGDAPEIALLGFSQGAAASLQALRLEPERFSAVVALSGYASPDELPNDESLRESRPRVFWGRGTNDDVIPTPLIEHTSQWLPDHSELTGRVYPGLTHSISEDELVDVRVSPAEVARSLSHLRAGRPGREILRPATLHPNHAVYDGVRLSRWLLRDEPDGDTDSDTHAHVVQRRPHRHADAHADRDTGAQLVAGASRRHSSDHQP